MHKQAVLRNPVRRSRPARTRLSVTHAARHALPSDAAEIYELLSSYTGDGVLLPRTEAQVEASIGNYVVVVDVHGRVKACAALVEYSPSLAEVGSVAVDRGAQGKGLGSLVVQSVEAMARRRGVRTLFAVSSAERFFESLGYAPSVLSRFPEKLASYEALAARGVTVAPKACFQKALP